MSFIFGDVFRDPFNDPFFRDPFGLSSFGTTPLLLGSGTSDTGDRQVQQQQQGGQLTSAQDRAWETFRRGPRLDLVEKDKEYEVHADLPGMKKEDVDIRVDEGNILVISGERKQEKREESDQVHRRERVWGKFQRAVRLPEAEFDKAQANMENGVLTIKVPKVEKTDETKKINIS